VARIVQILVALVATCGYPVLAETNYSKKVELPPLRISFSELQAVLDKGASLMSAANASMPVWREEIEVRKGGLRVKITGHVLEPEGAKVPNSIDSFDYTASTRDPAAVSGLALSFADYTRSLSVEGQSPEQVDAVFSALREDLSNLSTSIGGFMFRSFLGFPAIFILFVVLIFLGGAWVDTRRRILLLPVLICVALLLVLMLLPIGDVFAGFSAVHGDASFKVRYAAEISFWGFIVGAVMIPMSLIPLVWRNTPKTDEVSADSEVKSTGRKRRGGSRG
jgi:hypothetical protein